MKSKRATTMEEPSASKPTEQPATAASHPRLPAKQMLIAAAVMILLMFGVLLSRHVTNWSSLINRGNKPPEPPRASVGVKVSGQLIFGSQLNPPKTGQRPFEGTAPGQDGDLRRYITGHPASPQRAIWIFDQLPQSLMSPQGDVVSAKLMCSILRLDKNPFGEAVVAIQAVSHTCPLAPPNQGESEWKWANNDALKNYTKEREKYDITMRSNSRIAKPGTDDWAMVNKLAEEYGYCEVLLPPVVELTEMSFNLPAGLFRNALNNKREVNEFGKPKRPLISLYVKCETKGLLMGVMESDLYIVEKLPAK